MTISTIPPVTLTTLHVRTIVVQHLLTRAGHKLTEAEQAFNDWLKQQEGAN